MQQNMQFLCLAGIFYTDYMKVVYSSKYKIKLQILGERLFSIAGQLNEGAFDFFSNILQLFLFLDQLIFQLVHLNKEKE